MIIVIGSVTTDTANHDEAMALSLEHCARSRAEPGCIDHRVHVDCTDPLKLVFVEYWADMAALQVHFGVPECKVFAKNLGRLAATPPTLKIFEASELPVQIGG